MLQTIRAGVEVRINAFTTEPRCGAHLAERDGVVKVASIAPETQVRQRARAGGERRRGNHADDAERGKQFDRRESALAGTGTHASNSGKECSPQRMRVKRLQA